MIPARLPTAASEMGRAGALRFAKEGVMVGVMDIDPPAVERLVRENLHNGGRAKWIVAGAGRWNDGVARGPAVTPARRWIFNSPKNGDAQCLL